MGVQTQINRITGEVSTQQGLIGQLKEYVDGTTTEVAVQKNLIAQIKEQADRTATEVSIQHDLIQQVKTTLKGKGAGSGQLPALTNPGTAEDLAEGKQLIGADGSVITGLLVKGFAVKTGTTTIGGYNLVTLAQQGEESYIIVLLDSNNDNTRFSESAAIVNTLFGEE